MNNMGRGSHPVHSRGGRARVAAGLLLACTAGAAAQTVTFVRSDFGSVSGARAIVSADFNRDGAPDLAQANNGRNTVVILLNDRGGGFVRGVEVAVGAGPFAIATADLNRDGIADLAVANADGNSISVLGGNGDGSFTRSISPPPEIPAGWPLATSTTTAKWISLQRLGHRRRAGADRRWRGPLHQGRHVLECGAEPPGAGHCGLQP